MSRQRYPQIRTSLQSITEPSQTHHQEVECGIPLSQEESNSENLHTTTSGSEVSLDSSEHELLPSVYTRQTKRTTANAKAEDERIERILKEHVYDKIVPMIVNIDTQVRQIKSQMEDFSNQIQQIQEHLSSKVGDQKKILTESSPVETGVWNQCVSNPTIERLVINDEQGKSTESDSTLGDPIDD